MIDPALLARGRLYEAEVELEAEAIFRVSAVDVGDSWNDAG